MQIRRAALALALLLLAPALLSPAPAEAQRSARPAAARAAKPAPARKKVVVFVGMPGAGKSTAADRMARKVGTSKLSTGDVIRNTIKERGLEYNAQNDRAVAEEFAKRPGEIGRRSAAQVKSQKGEVAVVEGFRSPKDLDTFLRAFPDATVVSVEVGTDRRHGRMLKRGRAGEDNRAYLRDRDRAEVRRGVRDVMRRAGMRIRPRGDSIESLDRSVDRVLRRLGVEPQPEAK